VAQGRAPGDLAAAPDVVRELLARFVADAPSARHRQALEVCAHARTTTEDLLRAALDGDDGAELFAWLRGLSFVDEGPYGAFPHDVARAALDADLRWRDPSRYLEQHRAIRAHVVSRPESGHWPFADDPGRVASELTALLARAGRPAAYSQA
jgi:pimeloyl-ACP methyl ester carboxylesterase